MAGEEQAGSSHQDKDQGRRNQQPIEIPDEREERYAYKGVPWQVTFQEFKREYQKNALAVYHAYGEAVAKSQERRTQIQQLEEKQKDHETQVLMLVEERDRFRDALALHALERGSSTPAPNQPAKSERLPDPEVLTDGKTPEFEEWLAKMKGKLLVNADRFTTEAARMIYVQSRTTGEAAAHLRERMKTDAPDRFQTAEEMFQALENAYIDPNRAEIAKDDFHRLVMKKTDDYHAFLTKFLHLAGEAKIPSSERKYELRRKLPYDLQMAVARDYGDSTYDFKAFSNAVSIVARSWKGINELRERNRPSRTNLNNSTTSRIPAKPNSSRAQIPVPRTNNDDRERLMREGRCFTCKAAGHLAKDCPMEKNTKVNEIEPEEDQSKD
jgi:Zinc knuckle